MSNLVTKEFTLGGKIVNLVAEFEGLQVFSYQDTYCEDLTLYFTKDDEVVKELVVEADCGQNVGFISQFKFK